MSRRNPGANPPFSIRIPAELKAHVKQTAGSRQISASKYICALVSADMSGNRSRGPGRQHVVLGKELARIHAAIIACGNLTIASASTYPDGALCTKRIIDELRDVAAAVLRLEDKARAK